MTHNLPPGEKIVVHAFFLQEMEERQQKQEALQEAAKSGFYCPSMMG